MKILIKNGKIIDGSENPWFKANITIEEEIGLSSPFFYTFLQGQLDF